MQPEDRPDQRATHAVRIDGVNGCKIRNVAIQWDQDKAGEKRQGVLYLKDVSDLDLDNFTGRQGLKNNRAPAVVLENVNGGTIRDSRATEECGTFVQFRGPRTQGLRLRYNDVSKAGNGFEFTDGAARKSVSFEPESTNNAEAQRTQRGKAATTKLDTDPQKRSVGLCGSVFKNSL